MESFTLDLDQIPDDISEHSHISDFLEELGFELETIRCGNNVDYDDFCRYNPTGFDAQVDNLDFIRAIEQALEPRLLTLRNIVFNVTDGRWISRISVSRARLARIAGGDDSPHSLRWALMSIWDSLLAGQFLDIYEDYDESYAVWYNKYNEPMEAFHIDTSRFAIVHTRSPAGAGIKIIRSLHNVVVEDPPDYYGFNNCVFNCISSVIGKKFDNINELRDKLRYSEKQPIKLKHLIHIARACKVNLVVFKDSLNNDGFLGVFSSIKLSDKYPDVNIVLNGGHYFLYKCTVKNINHDFDYGLYKRIIFYDMETFFDPITKNIEPYCLSYSVFSNNTQNTGHIIKDSFNDNIKDKIFGFFYNYMKDNIKTLVVGFNNGGFDDYILIDILSDYSKDLRYTLIDKRGRLLTFKWGPLVSKDLYRFLMTSLRNATESFGCKITKLKIDHNEIQRYVYMGRFDEYMTADMREKIGKYAEADVVSLAELYYKVFNEFKKINKLLDVTNSLTISQMSMNAFKTSLRDSKIFLPILKDKWKDDIVRRSIIGGRCDVFQKGEFYNVTMVDVCSLYPHIMISNEFPYFTKSYDGNAKKCVPNFSFRQTYKYIEDAFGVYEVTILSQPRDAIVPFKNEEDFTYNWHYTGVFKRWVTHVSVEAMLKWGCNFIVTNGWVIECNKGHIMASFLEPIMQLKNKLDNLKKHNSTEYNSALRECLKLVMNSLSGKMCQAPIKVDKILTNDHAKCDFLTSKHKYAPVILIRKKLWLIECDIENPKVTSPTIIGSMIFDLSRQYMYDNVITKVTKKYYMDTDSMLMDVGGLNEIDKSMFGDDHGKLKIELPMDKGPFNAIVVAKKCYCIYTNNNGNEIVHKFRAKGINAKSDKMLLNEELDCAKNALANNDYKILSEMYFRLPSVKKVDFMRKLCKGEIVHVLCSQICRTLRGNKNAENFMIANRFIIKVFPLDFKNENNDDFFDAYP